MRRSLPLWLSLGLLAAACSADSVAPPPAAPVNWESLRAPPPAMDAGKLTATEQERATADAYTRGLAAPGFEPLGRVFDENAHFAFAGTRDAHGRDAVVKAHAALFGAFEQRTFVASRVWLTDDMQALEWAMAGVQAREWEGVPPSQKRVVIRGISLLWTKDDGSITDVHVYFDDAAVKGQLGVGPRELVALPAPPVPTAARQELQQEGSGDEKANIERVRAAFGAFEKNDEAAYLGAMTDDVEVTLPERSEPSRGKEAVGAFFEGIHKAIADLDVSIQNDCEVKQFVVLEYSLLGEQKAPIGWIPLRRESLIRMEVVDVLEMREGKIARVWRYDNPSQILSP
jgi:ketosteroid isomerase-like protein